MNPQDKPFHILYCSRLVKEKGADILIDVMNETLKDAHFSSVIWHIVSSGDYEERIKQICEGENGRVYYYGKISQKELSDLMRKMDMLYMPSRFLETFGLTGLEALASGIPVLGIRKGGLMDFIPTRLAIDENDPVRSTIKHLGDIISQKTSPAPIDIESFLLVHWRARLTRLLEPGSTICLIHDYEERIGGAEAYVDFLMAYFRAHHYRVKRMSYEGKTSPIKRRLMFIFSFITFWRGKGLYDILSKEAPDHIWMHSILRYYGYWGVRAVNRYVRKNEVSVYLSHHDIGFIAPFPQMVYSESQIPQSKKLKDFLSGLSPVRAFIAFFKWIYISAIRSVLPKNTKHIIFSAFLEPHIKKHFPNSEVILLPHTFDDTIFHP